MALAALVVMAVPMVVGLLWLAFSLVPDMAHWKANRHECRVARRSVHPEETWRRYLETYPDGHCAGDARAVLEGYRSYEAERLAAEQRLVEEAARARPDLPVRVRLLQPYLPDREQADAVAAAVRDQLGPVFRCYQDGLQDNPYLRGRLEMSVSTNADGTVSLATVRNNQLGAPVVEACVRHEFHQMRFPEAEGGILGLSLPLSFEPER